MKRILVILPLVIILTVVGAILAFNMGVFHKRIEAEAAQASGAKVQLGKIQLAYSWPPHITIGPSAIAHSMADVRWSRLTLDLVRVSAPYSVRVAVQDPKIELKNETAQTPAKSAGASSPSGGSAQKPMHLKLEIKNGEILSAFGKLTGLDLAFEQKQLLKSPAKLALSGVVTATALPVPLPLKFESDALTLSEEAVKSPNVKVAIGGLDATVTGGSLLKEGRHRWLLNLSANDLAKLPQPPAGIPAKNWKGGVRAKVEVNKLHTRAPWSAEGEVHVGDVSADVDFKQDKILVKGPFLLVATAKFSYIGEKLTVHSLGGSLNLKAAQVEYQGMLSKAAGVPLSATILSTGDAEKLTIGQLEIQLWDLVSQIKGTVELKAPWPGQLQIAVQPVNLTGAERWLVPLRASPVKGQLAVNLRINGPLSDPMNAQIFADAVKLKGFSATVDYEKPGMLQVRGPVAADIEGKGEFTKGSLKSAEGQGRADLSAAALVLGPLRKEAGSKFLARFQVRNEGEKVKIDAFDLNSFFGNVAMKGSVENPTQPRVDLALDLKPLLLSELRIAMPEYREKIPKGTLNSSLKLNGRVDLAKPWHDWPLVVNGSAAVNLPEYVLASAPAAPAPAPAPGTPPKAPAEPPAEPFLPKGELTSKMRLGLRAQIATLVKAPDKFEGVSLDGQISGGKLTGAVSIKSIFGGAVEVRSLNVPLLEPKPVIQGSATWVNLSIREVLVFTKPEFKDFASGISAGQTDFVTPMPGGADFMSAVKARGEMNLSPVTFSTVKIGDMINTMISKAPMLKLEPAKVEPLKGTMKLKYEMAGGVLNVASLEGQDADGSEIQMKGKVTLASLQGDFVGTFAWAEPKIKGCLLEGNADAKGRMVIPMGIKGDLMSPGMSMLSDVAKKLASKALECEKDKAIEKLKTDGKKKLEDEVKKKLKGLLGG